MIRVLALALLIWPAASMTAAAQTAPQFAKADARRPRRCEEALGRIVSGRGIAKPNHAMVQPVMAAEAVARCARPEPGGGRKAACGARGTADGSEIRVDGGAIAI